MIEKIADSLERIGNALKEMAEKGDAPGHPFRGNQFSGGGALTPFRCLGIHAN